MSVIQLYCTRRGCKRRLWWRVPFAWVPLPWFWDKLGRMYCSIECLKSAAGRFNGGHELEDYEVT